MGMPVSLSIGKVVYINKKGVVGTYKWPDLCWDLRYGFLVILWLECKPLRVGYDRTLAVPIPKRPTKSNRILGNVGAIIGEHYWRIRDAKALPKVRKAM